MIDEVRDTGWCVSHLPPKGEIPWIVIDHILSPVPGHTHTHTRMSDTYSRQCLGTHTHTHTHTRMSDTYSPQGLGTHTHRNTHTHTHTHTHTDRVKGSVESSLSVLDPPFSRTAAELLELVSVDSCNTS